MIRVKDITHSVDRITIDLKKIPNLIVQQNLVLSLFKTILKKTKPFPLTL